MGMYLSNELLGFLFLPSVLAWILLGLVWWRRSQQKRRSLSQEGRLPPAPPGWRPVVGHLHLLGALPHQALAELASRHGPNLLSLRLGSVPAVVASTPKAAQLILQTHDQAFASHPRTAASLHLGFNSDIVVSPPNAYWRRMRQLCATDLFSNKRVHSFQPIRREGIRELLRAAFKQRDQVMEMRPKLLSSSLNVVSRMTVGQRLYEVSPEATDLISELMHLVGVFNLGDFIPWLAFLDLQGYERRMKHVGQRWSSLLQQILDLRRAAGPVDRKLVDEGHDKAGFIDLLDVLRAVPELTDNNIKAVIADMFLGGTETTSITIEWALAELVANPTTMRTLQEELDRVVGKTRYVQEGDLDKLPYLHAVVKEAMRLHPTAPFLVPHESIEACEVYGYMIPTKARVFVNVWAIGRDPDVWENPLQFEPERFMPEGRYNDVNVYGQHFQLLPFGSGKRKCPALTLGLLSVHIMLASLVHAFDWALPPTCSRHQLVDFSEKFGLSVTMASPLSIIPTPRLEAYLYDKEDS